MSCQHAKDMLFLRNNYGASVTWVFKHFLRFWSMQKTAPCGTVFVASHSSLRVQPKQSHTYLRLLRRMHLPALPTGRQAVGRLPQFRLFYFECNAHSLVYFLASNLYVWSNGFCYTAANAHCRVHSVRNWSRVAAGAFGNANNFS